MSRCATFGVVSLFGFVSFEPQATKNAAGIISKARNLFIADYLFCNLSKAFCQSVRMAIKRVKQLERKV
jgi:hypothetical protein